MRILFFILTCIILVGSKIIIEDANIAAPSHDDIGMIFYIALHNTDNCGYRIFTRMVKCIEEVEVNDKECEMMQLLGGDMGEIKPQCYKNITLLYPNMYLHNRKGYCIIAIKFLSEDNQVLEKKTNVSFNTYLSRNAKRSFLLSSYLDKVSYTLCDSVDLDPLQNCAPVDCHMKYLGTRSYFNRKWRRCQKVPVCVFDVDKELPDVGYSPITNKCIDLERYIKKSDLQPLENKYEELSDTNSYSLMLTAINCHYGKINNESGLCDCMPGWTSAPFDKEPTLFPIHMCNVELSTWYDSNRTEITFVAFIISVVAVAVAMAVVLISFILYHLYKCMKITDVRKTECYCDLEAGNDSDKKDKKKSNLKQTPSEDSKASKSSDKKSSGKSSENKETTSDTVVKGKEPKKKASDQNKPKESSSNLSDKKQPSKQKKQKTESVSDQSTTKKGSSAKKDAAAGKKKKKAESVKSKPSTNSLSNPSNKSSKELNVSDTPLKPSTTSVSSDKKARK